jgi:hypothetical protein
VGRHAQLRTEDPFRLGVQILNEVNRPPPPGGRTSNRQGEPIRNRGSALRRPRPAGLKSVVTERYGEPSAVPEVGLPFMQKGIAFLWYDTPHPACSVIGSTFQTDLGFSIGVPGRER